MISNKQDNVILYLSDLEFTSSGSTVIISSNGQRFAAFPPNLLIKSTTGFCQEDICKAKSAKAKHNCKHEDLTALMKINFFEE